MTSTLLALAHINLLKRGIFTWLYGVLVSRSLEEVGTREGREKKGGFRFAEEMLFFATLKAQISGLCALVEPF